MKNHLFRQDVEIQIHFGPAKVRVGRHGIPNAAGLETREPHDDLAGRKRRGMNDFVKGTLVPTITSAQTIPLRLLDGNVPEWISRVGRIRQKIKVSRLVG